MTSKEENEIKHMLLIAGRKQKDKLLSALSKEGGHIINTFFGRGSVKASLMDVLGFVHEEEKVVITCLVTHKEANDIFEMLIRDFRFDRPNTGIAYLIPVDRIGS